MFTLYTVLEILYPFSFVDVICKISNFAQRQKISTRVNDIVLLLSNKLNEDKKNVSSYGRYITRRIKTS